MPEQRKFGSLEEMREALGGNKSVANCKECGRQLKDAKFDTCYDCSQKKRAGQNASPGNFTPARLPEGYLAHGYFYEPADAPAGSKNQKCLRDELITTQTLELAKAFASIGLTTGQLRRFYSDARFAAQRLEYGEPFAVVRPAILKLKPMVANAVARAKSSSQPRDYELFKQFIDRNIAAITDEDTFVYGFVPHFQYVVAYFTYEASKDNRNRG